MTEVKRECIHLHSQFIAFTLLIFESNAEFFQVKSRSRNFHLPALMSLCECSLKSLQTIGTTLMAASGLNPERRRLANHPYEHLYQLIEFALSLQDVLNSINENLLNFEFTMKIGYNIGPVTAGVIGTTKVCSCLNTMCLKRVLLQLYYDIWGDTVNIASRMYSNGVSNKIQVPARVMEMLKDRCVVVSTTGVKAQFTDTNLTTARRSK